MPTGADWQPLIGAVASLVIALTPIAVMYLNVQVGRLKKQVELQFSDSRADRAALHAEVKAVAAKVDGHALAISARRDRREGDKP